MSQQPRARDPDVAGESSPLHGVGKVLKHHGVRRATLIGRWLGALCVGLVLVFATASAASVVDRFKHGNDLPHDHAVQHTDANDQAHEHSPDSDDGAPDEDEHQPGLGHHHSDAPAGALVRAAAPMEAVSETGLAPDLESTRRVKGVRPGGLERPPRFV